VKRIAVIGAGGAGKTRLARALGQVLDLLLPLLRDDDAVAVDVHA
jgi:adenylate kinase family enzyme